MIEDTFYEESAYDKLPLGVLCVEPEAGKLRGILQISHGMCEAKERYLDFMRYMAGKGYACIIHDHRGHGQSVREEDHLGYMYGGGGKALVEDLHQITVYAKNRWPNIPLILFGHSMGSLTVRVYLKEYDSEIHTLIVCGTPAKNPALGMGKSIAWVQKKCFGSLHVAKLLQALSLGSYAAKFANEKSASAWVCSDPEIVVAYDADPLCGYPFKVDGYEALFQLMGAAYSRKGWNCSNPKLPILFVGGAEDPCMGGARKLKQSIDFMRSLGYCNIRGKIYPGLRHEILNETAAKDQVYSDIWKYIEISRRNR